MNEERVTEKKSAFMEEFNDFLEALYEKFNHYHDREDMVDEGAHFVDMVQKAHEEWKDAEKFFNHVSDPDLVDHAIYRLEAAKSRYTYLLKQAKKEGIKVNFH